MRTPDRFSTNSDLLQTPESRRKPSDCVTTPTAVTPKTPTLEMRRHSPNSESRHQSRIDAYASLCENLARHQTGMEPGLNLSSDFPSLESMEMPGVHSTENTSGSRLDGLKQDIPTFGFNDLLLSLEMNLPVQEPRADIQNFVMDNPIPSVNQLLQFSNKLPPRPINVELKNAQIMETSVKDDTDNIDDSTMKHIPSLPCGKPVTSTEVSNAMANNSVPIKPSQVNKSAVIIDPSIQKSSSQKENLQLITLTKSDEACSNKLSSKPATSVTQPESVHPSSRDSSLMPSLVKNKRQNSVKSAIMTDQGSSKTTQMEVGMMTDQGSSKKTEFKAGMMTDQGSSKTTQIEAAMMTDQGSSKTTQIENQSKETLLESNNISKQRPPSVSKNQPKINEQTTAISIERNPNVVTNRNVQGPSVANTYQQYQHPSHQQYQHPSHHHQYQNSSHQQYQHPSQSHATNFPRQPPKPLQPSNAPKQQFANQSEFPPYQYMHPQPSANAYFPAAPSYPPYSYNHAPYGATTYPYPYQPDGAFYSPYYQQGPAYFNEYINSYNRQFCANPYYSMQQANQVARSCNQQATNATRFNGQQASNVMRFNGQQASNVMWFNGQQVNPGLRSNAQPAIQEASLSGQQVKLGPNSNDKVNQVARFNNYQGNPRMRFNSSQANQLARLNDEKENPITKMNNQHFPYYSLNGIKRMKLPEAPTQVNKVTSSYLDHNKNKVERRLPNFDQCTNTDNIDPTLVQKDKLETDSSILNGNPIKAELSSATTDTKSLTNAIKTEELPNISRSNLTITNTTESNLTQNCTKCTNLKARMHSIKKSRINDLIFIIHDTDDDSCGDEDCTIETEELEDLGILCDDCGGVVVEEEEEVKAEPEIDDPEENDNHAVLNESITSPKNELDDCFNTTQSYVESLQYIQPSAVSIFKLTPREEPKLADFTAQNMKFLPQNSRSIFTPVETSENIEPPCIFEPKNEQKTRKGQKTKTESARGQTRRRGPGKPKGSGTRVKKKIRNTGKKCWNCFATKSSAWYTHRHQTKNHLCCSCYNYYKTRNEQNRKIEVKEHTSRGEPIVHQTTQGGPIVHPITRGGPIIQPITQGGPIVHQTTQGGPIVHQTTQGGPIVHQSSRGGPIIQYPKKRVNEGENDYEKPVNSGQHDVKPVIDSQHQDDNDVPVFLPQAKQNNSTLEVSFVEIGQDNVKEALNEKEDDFDVHILNVHKQSNILNQSNQESLATNDSGFSEDFFADLFDIDIKFINDVVDMNNKTEDGLDLDFFQNIDCSNILNSGETLKVLEIKNDKPQYCQKIKEIEGSQTNQPETNKKSTNKKPKANQRKKSSKRSKRKEKSVVPLNVGTVTVKTVDVKPEGKTPVFSYSFTLPNDL